MNILRFMIPKSSVEYITTSSTVRQALEKMRYHHYVAIPVIDDEGIYVGALRNDDLLKYFLNNGGVDFRACERESVMNIMDKEYSKPLYHSASVVNHRDEVVLLYVLYKLSDRRTVIKGL